MSAAERLALCLKCPALAAARKPLEKCTLCGCFVRGKTRMPWETCPQGKW